MTQQLGPEARALLAAARHSPAPSLTDHWAVRRSVAARIGAASTAVAASVATTKASASLLGGIKLSLISQFGVATVAGATLATSAMVVHSSATRLRTEQATTVAAEPVSPRSAAGRLTRQAQTPATTIESEPPLLEATPEALPESEAAVPPGAREPPAVRPAGAPSVKASAAREISQTTAPDQPSEVGQKSNIAISVAQSRLLDEGRALAQIQNALSEHRGSDALRLLELQTQQFTGGALIPERAAARVFALCDVGKRVESRAAAQRFAQVWPDSPLLGRVLATCK